MDRIERVKWRERNIDIVAISSMKKREEEGDAHRFLGREVYSVL
jgi:hypothetical protein